MVSVLLTYGTIRRNNPVKTMATGNEEVKFEVPVVVMKHDYLVGFLYKRRVLATSVDQTCYCRVSLFIYLAEVLD